MIPKSFLLMFLISFALGAARAEEPKPSVDGLKIKKGRLKKEILAMNKDLICKADADCVPLEVGSKPCGGPWEYLVASKRNGKHGLIKKKLSEFKSVDEEINRIEQLSSTCDYLMPPESKCHKGKCIAPKSPNL